MNVPSHHSHRGSAFCTLSLPGVPRPSQCAWPPQDMETMSHRPRVLRVKNFLSAEETVRPQTQTQTQQRT